MSHFVCRDTFYLVIALPVSTLAIFMFLRFQFQFQFHFCFHRRHHRHRCCLLLTRVVEHGLCVWPKREREQSLEQVITECLPLLPLLGQRKIDGNYCEHFAGKAMKMAIVINSLDIEKNSLENVDSAIESHACFTTISLVPFEIF